MADYINRPAPNSPPRHKSGFNPLIVLLILLLLSAVGYIVYEKYPTLTSGQDTPSPDNASSKSTPEDIIQTTPEGYDPSIADLGTRPDWTLLDVWQETITRDDFTQLLTQVYTVGDAWKKYITIHDDHAMIRTDTRARNAYYRLNFAPTISDISPQRTWTSAGDLIPGTPQKPLAGIHIAIDPGHMGGEFAKLEGRWFKIGDNKPVMEGEMTLFTAKLIKEGLKKLGARVYLIRGKNEPVNSKRPADYEKEATAKATYLGKNDRQNIERIRNRLFCVTGEIRARARRVNLAFKPDLVLCLHYNAERWDDPANPTLTANNHYHILLHGALTPNEIAHDDERFEMLVKILQRSHDEEKAVGMYAAHALGLATGLPHYDYSPLSRTAVKIEGPAKGVWARNLLANRIYQCPVIYYEPYVMNNQEVHDRVQLGDYQGTKEINGVPRKSIFREYADAVVLGLKEYYLANRVIYEPQEEDTDEDSNPTTPQ